MPWHHCWATPTVQLFSGELMNEHTNILGDEARLDISACSMWGGCFMRAFIDVRVFNPNPQSNWTSQLMSTYQKHKQEKHCQYKHRIREIERASFSPLVFVASGGIGMAATSLYKWLAALLSKKRNQTYNVTTGWLRTHMHRFCPFAVGNPMLTWKLEITSNSTMSPHIIL